MSAQMIRYRVPSRWIFYDPAAILEDLTDAKAAVLSLRTMPYQKAWVEHLQKMQLKREVAGTSRIEGAEFTERELDAALTQSAEQLLTRSQRQAQAAMRTYRWLETIPDDRPIDATLIREIHQRVVTGADDDHCPPGQLRKQDENVTFGLPRHRGAEGGKECEKVFNALTEAIAREFPRHDFLLQALAAHFHFAAMHPFLDGNGRTARALEALFLQRAGLKQSCFIAMSNYYYEEKDAYLRTLSGVSRESFDLTEFLKFGLRGIALQTRRLLSEIEVQVQKALFRNIMYDLFNRLETPRKRVIAERQMRILKLLLERDSILWNKFTTEARGDYAHLKTPQVAMAADINALVRLGALIAELTENHDILIELNLAWPTQITETEFFQKIQSMPRTSKGIVI